MNTPKFLPILKVYGLVTLLIVGWWTLAFKPKPNIKTSKGIAKESVHKKNTFLPSSNTSLTLVNRDDLKKALAGNFALMTKLIADWDIDAQILQSEGIESIQRLPPQDFLRSQLLGRLIQKSRPDELVKLSNILRTKQVVDDKGSVINLEKPYRRFLPQTYAAASFLLALSSPDQVVALPKRLREQIQIYPKDITDKISLDIDRYNAEKLFLTKPEVAFIAHYSHPATIQALSNQGMVLYMMKNLNTLTDITSELLAIGNIINRPLEAELLKSFMDAAVLAIDNSLAALTRHYAAIDKKLPSVLFVNCHKNFSIPTPKTLTGHLLEKIREWDISLRYVAQNEQTDLWTMPIDKEHILKLNPDCLIIAAENSQALMVEIYNDPALRQLSAVQEDKLYFVDEAIQQSPSQYIILAYHDLFQVLANLP